MSIEETVIWENEVYELDLSDRAMGGRGGVANRQAQQLANRTAYLKQQLEHLQGQQIQSLAIDGSGHLVATLGDATQVDLGTVVGPTGVGMPTGGLIGQMPVKATLADYDFVWVDQPQDGASVASATVNDSGHLVITLDTGLEIDAGNVMNGALIYMGTWDAAAGTPPSDSPETGQYWLVGTAGTTDLDGEADWQPGDWAVYDGAAWGKVDNSESAGGGSSLSDTAWDMASDPTLPAGATPGTMIEITGDDAVRDGENFVGGDIAIVNRDGTTVSNLTKRNKFATTTTYATLDSDANLIGTLSGGSLTISGTGSTAAKATVVASAAKAQAEFTINTLGNGAFFAGLWENSITLSTLFTAANDNGFFVVYDASGSVWLWYQTTAGSPPAFGLIAEWADTPAPGDVVTVAYDADTRTVQARLNGVAATLSPNTIPGTGDVYFATGQNAGSTAVSITADFGPTFSSGFSTYVGVHRPTTVFTGALRIRSESWNPADGYPNPSDLLPGDTFFASAPGTVPDDEENYYQGEGTWWDGGTFRHLSASPLKLEAMAWGGELPNIAGESVFGIPLGDAPAAMEGYLYRVPVNCYHHPAGATGGDIPAFYPAGCLVMVRNSQYEIVAYDATGYYPAQKYAFAAPEYEHIWPGMTPDLKLHPIMGNGIGIPSDNGGQFEFYYRKNPSTGPATAGQFGIFLPFNQDATVSVTPGNWDTPSLSWHFFLLYDCRDSTFKHTRWVEGEGVLETEVLDLSADPLAPGDLVTLEVTRNGVYFKTHIKGYRNGKAIFDLDLDDAAAINLQDGTWKYGFAAFKDYEAGSFEDAPKVTVNTGGRPFAYVPEASNLAWANGYVVPVNVGIPALSVNNIEADADGNIELPGDFMFLLEEQPRAAQGREGMYALDYARGRLYGPKPSDSSWGGTDLCRLVKRPLFPGVTQVDDYAIYAADDAVNMQGMGDFFIDTGTATGRFQIGFRFSSGLSATAYDYFKFGIGSSDWDYPPTLEVVRHGTYSTGISGSAGNFEDGEEWLFILDFDADTLTAIYPDGTTVSGGMPDWGGALITPRADNWNWNGDLTIRLQPDGNSLTPKNYSGKGLQTTSNPYREVLDPLKDKVATLRSDVDLLTPIVVDGFSSMPDPEDYEAGQRLMVSLNEINITKRSIEFVNVMEENFHQKRWRSPAGQFLFAIDGFGNDHTGSTMPQILASWSVPADLLGASGQIRLKGTFSLSANANAKDLMLTFGGETVWNPPSVANLSVVPFEIIIQNRHDEAAQFCRNLDNLGFNTSASASPVLTTVDTAVSQTLQMWVTLADAADTVQLEHYSLEILQD